MKFKLKSKLNLFLLSACALIQLSPISSLKADDSDTQGDASKKEIRNVEFSFTPIVENKRGVVRDSVHVDIAISKSQWKRIKKEVGDFRIEFRPYVGSNRGQIKRIMDKDASGQEQRWTMESNIDGMDLDAREACETTGLKYAQFRLFVRGVEYTRNGIKLVNLPEWANFVNEEPFKFVCLDHDRVIPLTAKTKIGYAQYVGNKFGEEIYKQLTLHLTFTDKLFNQVERDGDRLEARIYVYRDNTRVQIQKKKSPYTLKAPESDFTIPLEQACGELDDLDEIIAGKDIKVRAVVQAVQNRTDDPDSQYREYVSDAATVHCAGLLR